MFRASSQYLRIKTRSRADNKIHLLAYFFNDTSLDSYSLSPKFLRELLLWFIHFVFELKAFGVIVLRTERLNLSNERPWHIESFIIASACISRDLSDWIRVIECIWCKICYVFGRFVVFLTVIVAIASYWSNGVKLPILSSSFSIIHGTSEIKNASIASRVASWCVNNCFFFSILFSTGVA